jgi:hypothetical protein
MLHYQKMLQAKMFPHQKMLQVKMFPHGLILSFFISGCIDVPADAYADDHGKGRPRCLGLAPHCINLKSGMGQNRNNASPVFL